jgi:hypothetical protein
MFKDVANAVWRGMSHFLNTFLTTPSFATNLLTMGSRKQDRKPKNTGLGCCGLVGVMSPDEHEGQKNAGKKKNNQNTFLLNSIKKKLQRLKF